MPWAKQRDALTRWAIRRAPLPLLTQPHEVFLACALTLIGVGLVVGEVNPASVAGQVPAGIRDLWAWSILSGSVLTNYGLFTTRPRAEWSGQLLTGWGCFFYAWAVILGVPFSQGAVSSGVFFGLSLVSWWRCFKVTNTALVQERLTTEARRSHVRAISEWGNQ